jgi:hypothetical protein
METLFWREIERGSGGQGADVVCLPLVVQLLRYISERREVELFERGREQRDV